MRAFERISKNIISCLIDRSYLAQKQDIIWNDYTYTIIALLRET